MTEPTEDDGGATVLHIHEHRNPDAEPIGVKLIKNTKGYGWEISVRGKDIGTILDEIEVMNDVLDGKYGAVG